MLNRENTLLFSEGSKDNCQSYFKEVENLLKNIAAMHELCKNPQENIEKIRECAKEIKKNRVSVDNIKARFDLSYTADLKKIAQAKHRIELKGRIASLEIKDKLDLETQEQVCKDLIEYDKDNLHSVYRQAKQIIKKYKKI